MTFLTVAICTLDRKDALVRAVESVLRQRMDPVELDVLVVDNGCTDGSAEVLSSLQESHPNLRVVREDRAGTSNARNRATEEARGRYVAFLDDDAEADPEWAASLVRAHVENPEVCAIAGRIEVAWPKRRPWWLSADLEGYFGRMDQGGERCLVDFANGSNMSIERSALQRVGGFSPMLGPQGGSFLSEEEPELFERLRGMGERVLYEPAALVHHHIPPGRVSPLWLARRIFDQGRSRCVQEQISRPRRPEGWREVARWALKESLKPRLRVEGMSAVEVRAYRLLLWGYALQSHRLSRAGAVEPGRVT